MIKRIYNNKIIKNIISILEWIVCLVLIFLIIFTGFQRFSNQNSFFGYRIYTIASGSMIPIYNVGDTLLIKEMSASEISVGDAVTYVGEDDGLDGMIITHQVTAVDIDENGSYYFHTKGVANNIEDPIVSEEQVLGKVVYKFFFLSLLGKITTSMPLLLIFIILPLSFLIAVELIRLIYKNDESNSPVIDINDNKDDTELKKDDIINEEDSDDKDKVLEDNSDVDIIEKE